MAHGNYDCCALCDGGLGLTDDSRAKEDICETCSLFAKYEFAFPIESVSQLIQFTQNATPDQLKILAQRYEKCSYKNHVDDVLASLIPQR